MALIAKRGTLPKTPHTEFYVIPDILALEEIHGSFGFSGAWSRKIHVRNYPTQVIKDPKLANFSFVPRLESEAPFQPYLIHSINIPYQNDFLTGRTYLCAGTNSNMSIIKTEKSFPKDTFFKNGEHHELFFIQDGEGVLASEFGELKFKKNDYIIVPKATTYRVDLTSKNVWALLVESKLPIEWPVHYMNQSGQAHMAAPVVETEIEIPALQPFKDEKGEFLVFVKAPGGKVTETVLGHHPFDVAGWEGALYPFIFPILNHHGIAREIHTAPPVHQTFQSGQVPNNGFSLCSFVPQMEGWHPKEVPAPYAHLNVDSDEFMFFCNGSYGARKGIIQDGSITLHPGGIAHSPHGLAARKSLDSRGQISNRLAVMLDTYFDPLTITKDAIKYADPDYATSWSRAIDGVTGT